MSSSLSSRRVLPVLLLSAFLLLLPSISQPVAGDSLLGSLLSRLLRRAKDVILPSGPSPLNAVLTTLHSCILQRGSNRRVDPLLGDLRISPQSPYCSAACGRHTLCCPPQSLPDLRLRFILFDLENRDHEIFLDASGESVDAEARSLLTSAPSVVWLIHGFWSDIFTNDIFNQTKDAYVTRRRVPVILVDWSDANKAYLQSLGNVRSVGAAVALLMDRLSLSGKSTCVGFSLGAHVCGEAGAWLTRRRGKQRIAKCVGIDPAGPAFDGCLDAIRLDKNDCQLVVGLHTSQFRDAVDVLSSTAVGTKGHVGHCDFWANDGTTQPDCKVTLLSGSCSHSRGMDYFLSQVQQVCHFKGREAECGGGSACLLRETGTSNRVDESSLNVNGSFAPIGGWRVPGKIASSSIAGDRQRSKGVPASMPVPPDDSCSPSDDVDYQFETSTREPFC